MPPAMLRRKKLGGKELDGVVSKKKGKRGGSCTGYMIDCNETERLM